MFSDTRLTSLPSLASAILPLMTATAGPSGPDFDIVRPFVDDYQGFEKTVLLVNGLQMAWTGPSVQGRCAARQQSIRTVATFGNSD